jgi:hypothetical protein
MTPVWSSFAVVHNKLVSEQMLVGIITLQRKRLYTSLLSEGVYQVYLMFVVVNGCKPTKRYVSWIDLSLFLEMSLITSRSHNWLSMVFAVDKERILINDRWTAHAVLPMSLNYCPITSSSVFLLVTRSHLTIPHFNNKASLPMSEALVCRLNGGI